MACHLNDFETDQATYLFYILLDLYFVLARYAFPLLTPWRDVTGMHTAPNNKW
jgi:hypothetical protein